jgi:glutamate/tyrosine decarboxylase-like PLP-dependent enzyme
MTDVLRLAYEAAKRYQAGLEDRTVAPGPSAVENLRSLEFPVDGGGIGDDQVIKLLDEIGSPATVASTGGRFFGFVVGGVLPASLGASWLADTWDQNAGIVALSPLACAVEEISMRWVVDLLGLPTGCGCAFVTGATMANFACLAAARHSVLKRAGWDVEADGLFGAPQIDVVVGEEAHATIFKALGMLGLGRKRVITIPVDDQGRMRADKIPPLKRESIVCIQAGNVNSGAFDPATKIIEKAHSAGAWVHVDGAFGLWARLAPKRAHLVEGYSEADSWATDAHKWPNVSYDSGLAFVRETADLRAAMSMTAAYFVHGESREPFDYTPETSRRARGVGVWAAIASLGRNGLEDIVERTCRFAERFAVGLKAAGYVILNDVVINQVLVSFGDDETTKRVIAGIQADGTCWCGGTVWQGRSAMRISVSSWATTEEDVERSLEAMIRIAQRETRS